MAAMDMELDGAEQTQELSSTRVNLKAETAKLYRVYKTVCSMLHKRGYMVPAAYRNMTPAHFIQKAGDPCSRNALTILVEKDDDETDQIFVFFPEEEKVGVKPIKELTVRMKEENVKSAILVVQLDITPSARLALQEVSDTFRLEYFKEAELLVDITEHVLVPLHQVLTPTEKQDLLKRYRLKETQLPRIQIDDPVARFYGMKRGQVVKIIRPSETAGRYVTYRICL